ncbi:hypothetical protein PAHAL_1G319500 [Panicum hallii]|uniref:Uncharacterized protein n=1 Tax=Panicum hallii TaxID=206008 RepID=A0A2S3GRM5_9POAL|nr:hypothetical protein PAHAL_1G319500 [Panicum hallii]
MNHNLKLRTCMSLSSIQLRQIKNLNHSFQLLSLTLNTGTTDLRHLPAALIRQTIAQWAAPKSGREPERNKLRTRNQSGTSISNNPIIQRHEQLLPKTPLNPLTTSTLLISKKR